MPADPHLDQLLMTLSADALLEMLGNPNVDPLVPGIPDMAFNHAARLVDINLAFQRQVAERRRQRITLH
jgi:hypothetical protein